MAEIDLTDTYQNLYEQALWTLVEIDHGMHGRHGAEQRAVIVAEIEHLKKQACGRRSES